MLQRKRPRAHSMSSDAFAARVLRATGVSLEPVQELDMLQLAALPDVSQFRAMTAEEEVRARDLITLTRLRGRYDAVASELKAAKTALASTVQLVEELTNQPMDSAAIIAQYGHIRDTGHALVALLMGLEPGSVAVARAGCKSLESGSAVPRHVARDALARVLAAMETHAEDAEVARRGCGSLCRIVESLPEKGRSRRVSAALARVAAVMETHAGDASVAKEAIGAIKRIADDARWASPPVAAPDAVTRAVVAATVTHAGDAALVRDGSMALVLVFARLKTTAAAGVDAVAHIVAGVGRASASDVWDALTAAANIVHAPGALEAALGHGVLARVVAAMQKHAGSPDVVAAGCHAIGEIMSTAEARAEASCSGALDRVVVALEMHADSHDGVAREGCFAISAIMDAPENRAAASAGAAVLQVTAAMSSHGEDGPVQDYGEMALDAFGLSYSGESKTSENARRAKRARK